jgi:transposase InsO family protein
MDGERGNSGKVDGPPRPCRARQEAAKEPDPTGQAGGPVPGSRETELRRTGTEPEAGRRYDRISTDESKFYSSTAIDLFSRRLLGFATSAHPDAELAGEATKMAVAARAAGPSGWLG